MWGRRAESHAAKNAVIILSGNGTEQFGVAVFSRYPVPVPAVALSVMSDVYRGLSHSLHAVAASLQTLSISSLWDEHYTVCNPY